MPRSPTSGWPWLCAVSDDDQADFALYQVHDSDTDADASIVGQPQCCFSRAPGLSSSSGGLSAGKAPNRVEVLVHVYDLGDSFLTRGLWNTLARSYGAFHTGVEVYGREWSFGTAPIDAKERSKPSGVAWHPPRRNPDHSYRETLSMGFAAKTRVEVALLIEDLKLDWRSSNYNVLSKNCHDFTNVLLKSLGVSTLPQWVNSLALTGVSTREFFENTDSGYDGGASVFELIASFGSGLCYNTGWDDRPSMPSPDARPRRVKQGHF